MDDCVTSCYLGFASGGLTLVTIYALRNDFRTFLTILMSQLSLIFGVRYVFPETFNSGLTFIINTLACVIGPLDTLDKVLKTRDMNYVHYVMHGLGVVNGFIWTIYHFYHEAYNLSMANALGILCEAFLLIGCLYAKGELPRSHIAVQLAFIFSQIFFAKP